MGSMYFFGWTISCVAVPRLSDVYGRRIPVIVSATVQCGCYLTIIFSRNLELTISFFFFLGLTCSGKIIVNYVYFMDFIPVKYQNYVGSIVHVIDGSITIFICLYSMVISKHWEYF